MVVEHGRSRWFFIVSPEIPGRRTTAEVRAAAAEMGRKTFGEPLNIAVTMYADHSINLDIRTQGHPVLDPRYVDQMTELWRQWVRAGWGERTTLHRVIAAPIDDPAAMAVKG